MASLHIGPFLRKHGWDIRSLGFTKLTHRVLEHDLPLIVEEAEPLIFDVGANEGQTIEAMRKLFPRCSIRAFEPASELVGALRKRYHAPEVIVENVALGAAQEERSFQHYENSALSSFLSLTKNDTNPFAGVGLQAAENVRIDTVDDYCATHGIERIHLLKIDTQGFDLNVLKGAARMFAVDAIGCVLVEINFIPLYEGQCRPGELIDWLGALRFVPVAFYEQVIKKNGLVWATACFVKH